MMEGTEDVWDSWEDMADSGVSFFTHLKNMLPKCCV